MKLTSDRENNDKEIIFKEMRQGVFPGRLQLVSYPQTTECG